METSFKPLPKPMMQTLDVYWDSVAGDFAPMMNDIVSNAIENGETVNIHNNVVDLFYDICAEGGCKWIKKDMIRNYLLIRAMAMI